MRKKENIVLDARLQNVIGYAAFRASLANGHEITAFGRKRDEIFVRSLREGDLVRVEMSPYDMSKGCIIKQDIQ